MTQPIPTPSTDAGAQIDAAIRQYLHSPQVSQGIRATLRHAIIAACFEHGRALKIGRLAELLNGVEPQNAYEDEFELMNAMKAFVRAYSNVGPIEDKIRDAVEAEVSRQLSELKITRSNA